MAMLQPMALAAACLLSLPAIGGEIIILEPSPKGSAKVIQVVPETSDRGSERAMNRARREAGKPTPGSTIIISDEALEPGVRDNAEEAAQSAGEYLRPTAPPVVNGSTAVILRSPPMTDSERARQRARNYVVPQQTGRLRDCVGAADNQVGTVGEGSGSASGGVVERGSSNVNLQSYCR